MEYIMLLDYGYRRSAMNFQHAENENKYARMMLSHRNEIKVWVKVLLSGRLEKIKGSVQVSWNLFKLVLTLATGSQAISPMAYGTTT